MKMSRVFKPGVMPDDITINPECVTDNVVGDGVEPREYAAQAINTLDKMYEALHALTAYVEMMEGENSSMANIGRDAINAADGIAGEK